MDDNHYNDNHNMNEDNHNMNDDNRSYTEQESQENQEKQETNGGITQSARNNTKTNKSDKPKRKKSGYVLSGLAGGLISAIAVAAVLLLSNIIPNNDTNTASESASNSNNQAPEAAEVTKTINTEDANVASNLDEASKAVVGVTRMKQTNVWEPNKKSGTGSGVIYKKEDGNAYVVTNHHVVDGAQNVEVALNNDKRIKAEVLGSDELSDLAVLKTDGSKIDTVANLGSSSDMKVGETAVAIGNPLGMKFANTLTKGIISGLDRSVQMDTNGDKQPDWVTEVIQTDAAVNPGNSGGALVNAEGKVIGINSMKIAQTAVEGIAFAIPIDTAMPVIKQLENEGKVARPYLGISTASVNQVPPRYRNQIQLPKDKEGGMVIAQVETGSPAQQANLQQFDVITKINGNKISSLVDLRKFLYNKAEIGQTVELEIYRNGESKNISVDLVERKQN